MEEAPKMALSMLSTETLARVSARRPWTVVGIWVAVIAASIAAIGVLLSGALTTEVSLTNNPESQRAENLLKDNLQGPEPTNEIVIVRSDSATVDDPQFREVVEGVYGKVSGLGTGIVAKGTNFYQSNDPSLVSTDRHTTILPFVMAGDHEEAQDRIDPVLNVVKQVDGSQGFHILITGRASMSDELQTQAQHDLETGESIGIPIALVVLIIVFGA